MNTRRVLVAVVTWALAIIAGCTPPTGDANLRSASTIAELSVDDVAKLLDASEAEVFDANNDSTRQQYGVVPGATLLSSSSQYDTSLLPSDLGKQLIFYCANDQCSASDTAAERAVQAGHKQVAVMRDGIAGWVAAGEKTEQPTAS